MLMLAGLAVLAFVTIMFFERWLNQVLALPVEEAMGKLRLALLWLMVAGCLALAGLGAWLWRLGSRVVAAKRVPLPGSRVIRDTKILVGEAAVRRGKLTRTISLFLLFGDIALVISCWRLWLLLPSPAL